MSIQEIGLDVAAGTLRALGDPVRLRLLHELAQRPGGESCVCDLLGLVELSQPTVSHHLKVLREAGLVASERRGTWVYYRVIPEALQPLSALLASMAEVSGTAQDCR
ncbi:metalloregulator ArsR/SmtB family transcription factor [Gordonia sp. LSe1-13]|uniref:Metalloregulator ArsR/SmtB family transcription factor n=1 Tax=Gordonia sesuvii TaxID=3116777 RepID=A0ABU7MG92_9ACTN|nr:metalloregulator ArsR/SmtB family transcription factor [Gordonia sp. LSe1-13]